LAKEEELLLSVEDKWIRGQIAKDTYERWYKVYTTNINNMKSFIERIGKSQDRVFDLLKRNFDLLTDMRYVYSEADTLDKREFVRQVFDSNLY
jgi:site-specific DNA recombinase